MDLTAFLAIAGLALYAMMLLAASGVAFHQGPRTPYAVRLLAVVALAFAVGGLGLRLTAEVVSRDIQLYRPTFGPALDVELLVSSAAFLLLSIVLTATSSAMAGAAAARRQAWGWLLLLGLGSALPLLVALGLFLFSALAKFSSGPPHVESPLFLVSLLASKSPIVALLVLAPLASVAYGIRAVQQALAAASP